MNLRLLLLSDCLTFCGSLIAQTEFGWPVLADAKFRQVLVKKYNSVYLIPKFGKGPRAFEGKEVTLSGYIIPLTADFSQLVLSKRLMLLAFFCGQAGPETVVELELKPKTAKRRYRMDDYLQFKGILRLNRDDPRYLCYRLTDAEIYKK